jgi:tetratricopeptide (TPR) repeat protein
VAKSLVGTEESGIDRRYRLLETVRLYAEEKLLAAGESDKLRTAHRDWVISWLESADRFAAELFNEAMAEETEREQQNIRAALDWVASDGRFDLIARIIPRSLPLWGGSAAAEASRWLDTALEHRADLTADQLVACLAVRSWLANVVIDADTMLDTAGQAVAIECDGSAVWHSLAYGILSLRWSFDAALGSEAAIEKTESAGQRAVEAAERVSVGASVYARTTYGMSLANLGELERSATMLSQAAQAGAGVRSLLRSLVHSRLSLVLHLLGRHDDALEQAKLAVASRTVFGWGRDWDAWSAITYGLALASKGRWSEARAHLDELLTELKKTKIPGFLGEAFAVMGAIAAMRSDWERASKLLAVANREVAFRSPPTFVLYGRNVELVRNALDDATRRRCRNEGALMSIDEAIDYGLDGIPGPLP